MDDSVAQGNDPSRWAKILHALDDKLQLGLLERLRGAISYHFEADVLYIEPGSDTDLQYLSKETVLQQLQIIAGDSAKVEKVKIKQK